jgi:hypothetical protein
MSLQLQQKTHLKVLQHLTVVAPYVNEQLAEIKEHNPLRDDNWITREHNL